MKLMTLAFFSAGMAFSQSNDCDTLDKCREAVRANPRNSLAHFRLGDICLSEGNYQEAGNELRGSLLGDLNPRWIEVWAHVELGKLYDSTHQRERALNEYRQALRTMDNTRGALDEARKYTETPYSPN